MPLVWVEEQVGECTIRVCKFVPDVVEQTRLDKIHKGPVRRLSPEERAARDAKAAAKAAEKEAKAAARAEAQEARAIKQQAIAAEKAAAKAAKAAAREEQRREREERRRLRAERLKNRGEGETLWARYSQEERDAISLAVHERAKKRHEELVAGTLAEFDAISIRLFGRPVPAHPNAVRQHPGRSQARRKEREEQAAAQQQHTGEDQDQL